jgi:SAM-dependent methyltransferase
MAPSIALDELRTKRRRLRILDPMAGSGTTLIVAKSQGHEAVGFDTDPLAVLLAKAWTMDVKSNVVRRAAKRALMRAGFCAKRLKLRNAYPCSGSDEETRKFIRYWFDPTNRRQLAALARAINKERNKEVQVLLWCAFSRLIITKQASVSLAMDLSHSRPHRVRSRSEVHPFQRFLRTVDAVLGATPFKDGRKGGKVTMTCADARRLPIPSQSVDLIITSPPYLNAIDYLRCHKFSLVWMGYSVSSLRALRSNNIGSEVGIRSEHAEKTDQIIKFVTDAKILPTRYQAILRRYVRDMRAVIHEISRVLVPGGKATFVVGNSTLKNVYVRNSKAIALLGKEFGLQLVSAKSRVLPDNRRYLPPPSRGNRSIYNRMRAEIVMILEKAA